MPYLPRLLTRGEILPVKYTKRKNVGLPFLFTRLAKASYAGFPPPCCSKPGWCITSSTGGWIITLDSELRGGLPDDLDNVDLRVRRVREGLLGRRLVQPLDDQDDHWPAVLKQRDQAHQVRQDIHRSFGVDHDTPMHEVLQPLRPGRVDPVHERLVPADDLDGLLVEVHRDLRGGGRVRLDLVLRLEVEPHAPHVPLVPREAEIEEDRLGRQGRLVDADGHVLLVHVVPVEADGRGADVHHGGPAGLAGLDGQLLGHVEDAAVAVHLPADSAAAPAAAVGRHARGPLVGVGEGRAAVAAQAAHGLLEGGLLKLVKL
eukprot:scaffold7024_cov229-Pinguiococcus_pyrenoidosus.AAC.3